MYILLVIGIWCVAAVIVAVALCAFFGDLAREQQAHEDDAAAQWQAVAHADDPALRAELARLYGQQVPRRRS